MPVLSRLRMPGFSRVLPNRKNRDTVAAGAGVALRLLKDSSDFDPILKSALSAATSIAEMPQVRNPNLLL